MTFCRKKNLNKWLTLQPGLNCVQRLWKFSNIYCTSTFAYEAVSSWIEAVVVIMREIDSNTEESSVKIYLLLEVVLGSANCTSSHVLLKLLPEEYFKMNIFPSKT